MYFLTLNLDRTGGTRQHFLRKRRKRSAWKKEGGLEAVNERSIATPD